MAIFRVLVMEENLFQFSPITSVRKRHKFLQVECPSHHAIKSVKTLMDNQSNKNHPHLFLIGDPLPHSQEKGHYLLLSVNLHDDSNAQVTERYKMIWTFTVSWDFPSCHLICHCRLHRGTDTAGYTPVTKHTLSQLKHSKNSNPFIYDITPQQQISF